MGSTAWNWVTLPAYLRGLGTSEVFDYHAADWVQQVRATSAGGVDVLLDCAGGQARDDAISASAIAVGRTSSSCRALLPSWSGHRRGIVRRAWRPATAGGARWARRCRQAAPVSPGGAAA